MPGIRKLPSGKWQATVRLPDGRRITRAHVLKSTVKVWAEEEERRLRRGEWTDPRHARVTVGDWFEQWSNARVVQAETRRGDQASSTRVKDTFAHRPIGAVTRIEVQSWVRRMEADGVGPHAVRRAYNLLSTAYGAAVLEGVVGNTPCRRIALPRTLTKLPPWYTPDEVHRLTSKMNEPHATMTLVMCWLGLRWGECAGLRVEDVDWLRRKVRVVGAMSQDGVWKEYPKTVKSRREIPAPEWLIERMSVGAPGEGLLFTTRRQSRPLSGSNWRKVWDTAVTRAGVPVHTPHACRHTAASWLIQDGVPLHYVQAYLGHEHASTTERYAHLAPDAHDRVDAAFRLPTHIRRTDEKTGP